MTDKMCDYIAQRQYNIRHQVFNQICYYVTMLCIEYSYMVLTDHQQNHKHNKEWKK